MKQTDERNRCQCNAPDLDRYGLAALCKPCQVEYENMLAAEASLDHARKSIAPCGEVPR